MVSYLQRSDKSEGHFVPIGSNGFYQQRGETARFDQQPVEAQTMISACLEAYTMTGDKQWYIEARRAFEWYLGRNDLNLSVYDPTSGGCRDGLHPDRANENQGAESTLAFYRLIRFFQRSVRIKHLNSLIGWQIPIMKNILNEIIQSLNG